MIHRISASVLVCLAMTVSSAVSAQENSDLSGSLTLDKRFIVSDWWADDPDFSTPQAGFYSKGEIKFQRRFDDLQVVASVQMRLYDTTSVANADELSRAESHMAFDLMPWEVYVRASNVLLDGLDLSMGKQRMGWGRGDRLNPTNFANPDDFTDIFDFGAQVPSTAGVATYTFPNDWSLSVAWIPAIRPILTSDAWPQVKDMVASSQRAAIEKSMTLPPGFTLTPGANAVQTPEFAVDNSMMQARFDFKLLSVDMAISYFKGYEDIPVLKRVNVTMPNPDNITELRADTTSGFMPIQAVGLDLEADVFEIGLRAEAALVFPEGVRTLVVQPLDPAGKSYSTVGDDPYVKFSIGLDYHFGNDWYANLQYAHGLAHEIEADAVSEYIVGKVEKGILDGDVKFSLSGGYATPAWSKAADEWGYLLNPEILYKPMDALELSVGAYIIEGDGKGGGLFSSLDDADQLYLKAKASF